jgi:hypothetical protein
MAAACCLVSLRGKPASFLTEQPLNRFVESDTLTI